MNQFIAIITLIIFITIGLYFLIRFYGNILKQINKHLELKITRTIIKILTIYFSILTLPLGIISIFYIIYLINKYFRSSVFIWIMLYYIAYPCYMGIKSLTWEPYKVLDLRENRIKVDSVKVEKDSPMYYLFGAYWLFMIPITCFIFLPFIYFISPSLPDIIQYLWEDFFTMLQLLLEKVT